MTAPREPLFIGWAAPPKPLRPFLLVVAFLSIFAFTVSAYVVAATQGDPGGGSFRWDWGQQTLTGVIEEGPYPILHVTEGDRGLAGRSILLSGVGKRGVEGRADGLAGWEVTATGVMLTRGDLLMLQVRGDETGLVPVAQAEPAALAAPEDLGRWRLTGEICDGKCYAGAMRPGTGLAHKACANLCIAGGVPAVFVATGSVDGARFFLLGDANGDAVPNAVADWTALLVTLTGRVERRGGMPILLADLKTIELAR